MERQHRDPLCDFVFGVFAARKNDHIVPLATTTIERNTGCQVSWLEATTKKKRFKMVRHILAKCLCQCYKHAEKKLKNNKKRNKKRQERGEVL